MDWQPLVLTPRALPLTSWGPPFCLRFKTDLAWTRHALCLGRKLASLARDSKIYFPVATRCGSRNTAGVATQVA